MRINSMVGATATALLATMAGSAHAGTVSLTPDLSTISVGQMVSFDFNMDFTGENTSGGGTDFFYDATILQFVGWTFDSGFSLDDSQARQTPDNCMTTADIGCANNTVDSDTAFGPGLSELNDMGFVNFGQSGMTGTAVVGQLVFQAIDTGAASVFMAANADCQGCVGNTGPWINASTGQIDNPDFLQGNVTVVPVPAAVWLMFSGIGALFGMRRKA